MGGPFCYRAQNINVWMYQILLFESGRSHFAGYHVQQDYITHRNNLMIVCLFLSISVTDFSMCVMGRICQLCNKECMMINMDSEGGKETPKFKKN